MYIMRTRRHVGLLTVEVIEAKGLKKYDVLGKSDPFIELSTQPLSKEKTSVKKKTLTPTWNETKHVLVQVGVHRGFTHCTCTTNGKYQVPRHVRIPGPAGA